ncbi:5-formyltetrahydrofolate cyclo-ligase [bacterium]|nr:5-formyltetrahydrofolate cyclo-ligase [bacterium]
MNKESLRKQMIAKRRSLTHEEIRKASGEIVKKIFALKEFKEAKNIMCYYPHNNEVSTLGFMQVCFELGKKISLPVIDGCDIIPYRINNIDGPFDKDNTYNILEPCKDRCKKQDIITIDLIIVPGLAFDKNNNRLGFGKGYYDRFLGKISAHTKTIGIAYFFQVMEKIPVCEHDAALDMVIMH